MARYDEALRLLDEILTLDPTHKAARNLRAHLLTRLQVDELFRRGRQACREVELARAEALLHEALDLHPDHNLVLRWYQAVEDFLLEPQGDDVIRSEPCRQRLVTQAAMFAAQGDYSEARRCLEQAFSLIGGMKMILAEAATLPDDEKDVPRFLPLSKVDREAMVVQYQRVLDSLLEQATQLVQAGVDRLKDACFEEALEAFEQAASRKVTLDCNLEELRQKARSGITARAEAGRKVIEAVEPIADVIESDSVDTVQEAAQPTAKASFPGRRLELLRQAVRLMPEFVAPKLISKHKQFESVYDSLRAAETEMAEVWRWAKSLSDRTPAYDDVKGRFQTLVRKTQEPGVLLARNEIADDRWPGLQEGSTVLSDSCGMIVSAATTFVIRSYEQLARQELAHGRLVTARGYVQLALGLDGGNVLLLALKQEIWDREDAEKQAGNLKEKALGKPIEAVSEARELLQQACQLTQDEMLKRDLDELCQIALRYEKAQQALGQGNQGIAQCLYSDAVTCLQSIPETLAADQWSVIRDAWPPFLEQRNEALSLAETGQQAAGWIAVRPVGELGALTESFQNAARRLPGDQHIVEFGAALRNVVHVDAVSRRLRARLSDESGERVSISEALMSARKVVLPPTLSATWLEEVFDERQRSLHQESRAFCLTKLDSATNAIQSDKLDAARAIIAQVVLLAPPGEVGITEQVESLKVWIANEERSDQLLKQALESGSDKLDNANVLLGQAFELTQIGARKTRIEQLRTKATRLLALRESMEEAHAQMRRGDYEAAIDSLEGMPGQVEPETELWPVVDEELAATTGKASQELERMKQGFEVTHWIAAQPENSDLKKMLDTLKSVAAEFPQDQQLAVFHEEVRQVFDKQALIARADQQSGATEQSNAVALLGPWRHALESEMPEGIKSQWLGSLARDLQEKAAQGMQAAFESVATQARQAALSEQFDAAKAILDEAQKHKPTGEAAILLNDIRTRSEHARQSLEQSEIAAKEGDWLKALRELDNVEAAFTSRQRGVIAPRREQLSLMQSLADATADLKIWQDAPSQATEVKLSEYTGLADTVLPPVEGAWIWLETPLTQAAEGIRRLIQDIREKQNYQDQVRQAYQRVIQLLTVEGGWGAAAETARTTPRYPGATWPGQDLVALRERLDHLGGLAKILDSRNEDRFGKAWRFMTDQKLVEQEPRLGVLAQPLEPLDRCHALLTEWLILGTATVPTADVPGA